MSGIQRRIAEDITLILNPLLVNLYTVAILIFFSQPPSPLSFFVLSSFFGSIFPIAIILHMKKRDIISDIYLFDRQSRTKALMSILTCYLAGIVILLTLQSPRSLVALMTCYFINILVMMIISQFWKISGHAMGITGPATFLSYQIGIIMSPLFILLFPVAWARIKLKAHDMKQVIAGALLGIGVTLISVYVLSFSLT